MVNRDDIVAQIALSVGLSLRLNPAERLYPGWLYLFQRGIDPVVVGRGQKVPPDALEGLLRDAKSDADAFDACSTLAGILLHSGSLIEPSLRGFATDMLLGITCRPKRAKRSVGKGVRDNITRYIVLKQALSFFPMQKGKGSRTENGLRKKDGYAPDAFSVVSEGLCNSGLKTTPDQLKNLLNHPSMKDIRKFGDWACLKY